MLPAGYSNNDQIVQGRDHVVILVEMIHDARIIPLDGRPHLAASVRQLTGRPAGPVGGRHAGRRDDELHRQDELSWIGRHLRVTERFTRIDEDTLLYRFTVDDPHSFTRRWSGEIPMKKADGPLFEYACHEGNLSMEYILRAARAEERAAEEANRREVRYLRSSWNEAGRQGRCASEPGKEFPERLNCGYRKVGEGRRSQPSRTSAA